MFKKFAIHLAVKLIASKLDDPKFQESIIGTINRKIDIPKLNETQEKALFESVLKAVLAFIKVP